MPAQRFVYLPDGLLAVMFALAAAVDFLPVRYLTQVPPAFLAAREPLAFALFVEGGFLMMQGTLIDIATRVRARPPWWAVILIAGGVLLFSEHAHAVLRMAWEQGMVVFVPLLFSLADRVAVLWILPRCPVIEKIAARALISNRLVTGLALLAVLALSFVAGMVFTRAYDFFAGSWLFLVLGAIYFGIAAFDKRRVGGSKFAESPSVLFRYDLIGIDYLDPV